MSNSPTLFSPGIIHSLHETLGVVSRNKIFSNKLHEIMRIEGGIKTHDAIKLGLELKWLTLNEDLSIKLTNHGSLNLRCTDSKEILRNAILSYVKNKKPLWSKNIIFGRTKLLAFCNSSVYQVFVEAGLEKDITPDVLKFFDQLRDAVQLFNSENKTLIGRLGEELSLDYEENRTKQKPVWIALEDNCAGYDILSISNDSEKAPLQIEVKTSIRDNGAAFYLTRNEWNVAEKSKNYHFHFWYIDKSNEVLFYHCDKTEVAEHIPFDKGTGQWQEVYILFSIFKDKMQRRIYPRQNELIQKYLLSRNEENQM